MKDFLFLPYPRSFAKHCIYSLDEAVPIWFTGCTATNNTLLYSDLFEKDLKFRNLDKASISAINEFAMNIINDKQLLSDFIVPDISISMDYVIDYKPILKTLKNKNFYLLDDLKKIDIKKLPKLPTLGIKKVIYILISVQRFKDNLPETIALKEDEEISNEEALLIIEKYSDELPLDNIYLFDPRFRLIYFNYLPKVDLDLIEFPTWQDAFIVGNFSSNNRKIQAIKDLSLKYEMINNLDLEGQMSNFFYEFIKSKPKVSLHERHTQSFNLLKHRFGITKSISQKYTLQEIANSASPPITRERVRQLQALHFTALDSIPEGEEVFIPKLHEVLEIFTQNINSTLSDISQNLSEKGFEGWSVHRLFDCLDLFRLPNTLVINDGFISDESMVKANNYILKIAKKIISYNGAVNANQMYSAVNSAFPIERQDLLRVLRGAYEEVGDEWFFHETTLNLLINTLGQKIANFSLSFSLQSLREAHMKNKKLREPQYYKEENRRFFYGFLTPPSSVIERVMNSSSNYYVEDGNIICTNVDNKFVEDHSSADYQFLKYFQARNFECATFDEMKNYFLVQNKMAEGSFLQYLTYRPYIKRFATQIYGISGRSYDSVTLNNASNRIKDSVPTKIEWIESGIEIKEKLKLIGACTISIKHYQDYITQNEFKVFYDGKEYCSIKKNKSTFLYGMGPYLSDILFCEIGDFIRINLDLEKYEAKIELISEDEFEN